MASSAGNVRHCVFDRAFENRHRGDALCVLQTGSRPRKADAEGRKPPAGGSGFATHRPDFVLVNACRATEGGAAVRRKWPGRESNHKQEGEGTGGRKVVPPYKKTYLTISALTSRQEKRLPPGMGRFYVGNRQGGRVRLWHSIGDGTLAMLQPWMGVVILVWRRREKPTDLSD